ncbi:MAG: Beta-glucosidase [Bacteroidetes bacterium]|nr:Beta-glucosidase [Bacteroidota bacterium]
MQHKNLLFGASVLILGALSLSFTLPKEASPYEAQISQCLSKMTLEEKVGQMAQFSVDAVLKSKIPGVPDLPVAVDEAKATHILGDLKAGSLLNTPAGLAQTPGVWNKLVDQLQEIALKSTHIPMIFGVDAIHGANYTDGSILFPQEIAMAATFNRQLVYEGAKVCAYEVRASAIPWTFSPVLDMGRNPNWPRIWETYGEDPFLTSEMGIACVKGYQGNDPNRIGLYNIAACLKHFLGYGVPVSGQDRTPAMIPENELRERHLKPYAAAIKAGALSVMVNSGIINGEPVHASHYILTDILKNELKFDGVVVTDWQDINNLYKRDRIATSDKEAIRLSINAGIDMAMVPYDENFCKDLVALVKENKVPMSRIDDAVRRILRMKFRLGLFSKPTWNVAEYTGFASQQSQKLAKASADEAITLLKNKNYLLPLQKAYRILVTGPNANTKRGLNGGWSRNWQGDKTSEYEKLGATILEALQQKVGKDHVVYEPGVTYNEKGKYYDENIPEIEKAVAATKGCDVIVACIGENSYCETPGNLTSLELSKNQQALVSDLAKTGKPIVLVLNEGRPRIFSDIEPLANAVVHTYLPGSYGSYSLADILYGDVNPSGKLPYTYPKYTNQLTTYDYKPSENREVMDGSYNYDANTSVQYPFGFGLSYSTFKYSNLKVNKTHFNAADILEFSVTVKNNGKMTGKEAVLLYISDNYASLTPDNKRLRAFEKVSLLADEEKTVTLKVPASELSFIGLDNKWHLEAGSFTVRCGNQKLSINADETKVWESYLK